ncbi:MAG: FtsK/SpoIIIE domain-containing protein [Acidimicrobiales bacterium]
MEIALTPGTVLGVRGDRRRALAVVRSVVVQMCTHHGPADLALAVAADDLAAWEWCRWFPHTADHRAGVPGAAVVATGAMASAPGIVDAAGDRVLLAVLDSDDPFQGRTTVGRLLLAHERTAVIVLVDDAHRLPAACTLVAEVDELGRFVLLDPRRAARGRAGLEAGARPPVGIGGRAAVGPPRRPGAPGCGRRSPSRVPLLGLLGLADDLAGGISKRWDRTDGTAGVRVPIGADGDGPVELDLVADGPHVLIGGTTGSGKSELLRSLVAAIAASADPDHVAFVLIDYKGGAAFDRCADLPHVAGLVTDLDEDLAARALRCLEAELHHRETRLRNASADDLAAFRASPPDGSEPFPRLIVVVDEFASLAADLPEFLHALVGIAQRGRSLGVHLVLATQRPAGVVTDDIRANVPCRIALRTTDRGDSVDVIDAPDAASIPRDRPGRAVARFGPSELVAFQSGHATGSTVDAAGVRRRGAEAEPGGPTDLARLVEAISVARARRGGAAPRSPWPPPLPTVARRAALTAASGPAPALADWWLVDLPDQQRLASAGWRPGDGHLVVVGGPGAGATSTLAAATLAATALDPAAPPGADEPDVHVHVIDMDAAGLAPLGGLARVGTMIGPTEHARRARLVRWLDEEVERRRGAADDGRPRLVLVVDDFGGLARAHDPVRDPAVHERFARIWADGPAVGVTVAMSVRRAGAMPPDLVAGVGTVLVHRTADPSDGLRFGVRAATERFPPGRAVRSGDGAELQVVLDHESLVDAGACSRGDPEPRERPRRGGRARRRDRRRRRATDGAVGRGPDRGRRRRVRCLAPAGGAHPARG